jgi:hypothetical protein
MEPSAAVPHCGGLATDLRGSLNSSDRDSDSDPWRREQREEAARRRP